MPRQTPLPPELGTGPFTVAEAHALGLTEGRLRCDDLTRPSYGVRRLGPTEGIAQLAEATSLVLPVGSAFSHVTAARTLGLPVSHRWAPTEPLHVMRRENLQDDGWAFVQLTWASVMVHPRNHTTLIRLRRLLGLP